MPPENKQRVRAKDKQTELTKPKTAPKLPGASKFTAATRAWYKTWATSPQASQFIGTDWQRLHMLALIVDKYFRSPTPGVLAEICRRESGLGATPEDRLRLRWRLAENRKREEKAEAAATTGPPEPAASAKTAREDPRLKLVSGA